MVNLENNILNNNQFNNFEYVRYFYDWNKTVAGLMFRFLFSFLYYMDTVKAKN